MKPSFETDVQGDVLAIHRGDRNRDEILRYSKKMDVEDFRDGDEDGWRDEEEKRVSISREAVVMVERDGERSLVTSEIDDEQITSRKNDSFSSNVDVMEASSEKEDGHESLKQDEPLERVNRDDGEQGVFVSRDNEESGSGSSERDDSTCSREIKELDTEVVNGQAKADELRHIKVGGTEEDTGTSNRCEDRDENRGLEKVGEDKSCLMPRENDEELQSPRCETQVNDTNVRQMEMRQVTGEQDSSPCDPDAVKLPGDTFQNVYFSGPVLPQSPTLGHRRTQSEMVAPGHRRTNSFQRLKTQMQKAWRGVSNLRDDNRPTFNPEVLANQKRQWYQLHSSKALVFNLSRVSYQTFETSFWLRSSYSPL